MTPTLSRADEDVRRPDQPRAVVEARWAALDMGSTERARLAALLTPQERHRAERFRLPSDRFRYIARRGILRELLGARLGCAPQSVPLAVNAFGKPFVGGSKLAFNLSHSCGLALYVLGNGIELGCDIEWRRASLATREVAEHFFSYDENCELASLSGGEWVAGFFNCWTRKEALVKGLGLGLSYPLASFDVSVAPNAPAVLLRGPERWSLASLSPLAGLQAAIAVDTPSWDLQLWPLSKGAQVKTLGAWN